MPSHFLSLRDGLRLHYLDEGQGEPLVLLHGNPTWSYYYRHLIEGLRDRYRLIVPDHIGCGLSDKPGDDRYHYTLTSRVDDLESLLAHLNLAHVTLILHDWGGMIGLGWAHRDPQRVRRLVLLNTAGFPLPQTKRMPWSLTLCRMPVLGPLLVRGLNAFCRATVRWCVVRPLESEVRSNYLKPYDSWKNRIAVLRFVQDIPLRPSDPAYALVAEVAQGLGRYRAVPTLICWGEQDFVFDGHFLEVWRATLPQAQIHTFPKAGHFVLEDAGDEVLKRVRGFLGET